MSKILFRGLTLDEERLREYRRRTYRLLPGRRVTTREEAVTFVNERGYVYFWPVKVEDPLQRVEDPLQREVTLPSLWAAVAGDRPVPDEHDDPGHITWGWKDELLGARRWYYAKVLRRRATFIALDVVPCFYALSENYGAPEEDYLQQYREGRLTWEAKGVYEALLTEGPLDTISLRKVARMTSKSSDAAFARAIEFLQADFKILPIGIAEAGAWRYAFIYECVHRHYPDLPERARSIRQAEARRKLTELYLRSVGTAQERDLRLLFGWPAREVEATLAALAQSGMIVQNVRRPGVNGDWVALPELAHPAPG